MELVGLGALQHIYACTCKHKNNTIINDSFYTCTCTFYVMLFNLYNSILYVHIIIITASKNIRFVTSPVSHMYMCMHTYIYMTLNGF